MGLYKRTPNQASDIKLVPPVWDDQQVTIGRVRVGASAPTWTAYKGGEILAFNKSQDNKIVFDMQYSHRLKIGTNIKFHIHDTVPDNNSGDIRWVLTVSFADIDSKFPNETSYTIVQTIAINSQDDHIFFNISDNIGNSNDVSGIAICSLTRTGTHDDDTYNNDVYLIGLDAHLQIDDVGSSQELTK